MESTKQEPSPRRLVMIGLIRMGTETAAAADQADQLKAGLVEFLASLGKQNLMEAMRAAILRQGEID